jgi:hypothetical protein
VHRRAISGKRCHYEICGAGFARRVGLCNALKEQEGDLIMLALIATPTGEFIARRNAIRDSWTVAERKHRALVAHVKQHKLIVIGFAARIRRKS